MSLKFIILFFIFFSTQVFSQSHTQKQADESYIDTAHKNISDAVISLADSIDHGLNYFAKEDNTTRVYSDDTSVDSFFQNKKFLEETDNTYIRIRAKSLMQSKESTDNDISVRAQMPLSRTRKSLKLFIESFSEDELNEMSTKNTGNSELAPSVGVSYFNPKKYGIQSRYRLGIRNTNPYVQARYNKVYQVGRWAIEPTQTFAYSTRDDFSEETNIYFDKHLGENSLFRVELQRGTQSRLDGMNYGLNLSHFRTINKKTGLNFSQTFSGNTKYRHVADDSTTPATLSNTYGGLNNYASSINWRQNVWKKWFYYEIRPSINFARQYDYKANYSLLVNLDFYFGRFGKR